MLWRRAPALALLALAPSAASAGERQQFTEACLLELLRENPATGRPIDSISGLMPLLPVELRRKENLIFETVSRLNEREPAFREYSAPENVFATDDCPFGRNLGKAPMSCTSLTARSSHRFVRSHRMLSRQSTVRLRQRVHHREMEGKFAPRRTESPRGDLHYDPHLNSHDHCSRAAR
jgi:hypothetical protein